MIHIGVFLLVFIGFIYFANLGSFKPERSKWPRSLLERRRGASALRLLPRDAGEEAKWVETWGRRGVSRRKKSLRCRPKVYYFWNWDLNLTSLNKFSRNKFHDQTWPNFGCWSRSMREEVRLVREPYCVWSATSSCGNSWMQFRTGKSEFGNSLVLKIMWEKQKKTPENKNNNLNFKGSTGWLAQRWAIFGVTGRDLSRT